MIVTDLAVAGGVQKLVIQTSLSAQRMGHEVTVFAGAVDDSRCYPELIMELNVCPQGRNFFTSPSAFGSFARQLEMMDCVIVHDTRALSVVPSLIRAKPSLRVIWMMNHEYADWEFRFPRVALNAMRVAGGLRGVLDIPGALRLCANRRKAIRSLEYAGGYDRRNVHHVRAKWKVRTKVVYAGADLERYRSLAEIRESAPSRTGPLMVLSVGVMFPHRRYEDLISALDDPRLRASGVVLHLVGSERFAPSYVESLHSLCRDLALGEHVVFHGSVSDAKLDELFAEADVFAFVNEGNTWGISVFEALAAHLPVVITDTVGAADLLINELHCHYVSPRDPAAIADVLVKIASDPGVSVDLSQRASVELGNLLSWDAFTQRLLA